MNIGSSSIYNNGGLIYSYDKNNPERSFRELFEVTNLMSSNLRDVSLRLSKLETNFKKR